MNYINKKLRGNRKGFTLIELIVVIAVIGILVLLSAPKFLEYTAQAKEAQMKNDIKVVSYGVDMHMVMNNDEYPLDSFIADFMDIDQACYDGGLYSVEGKLDPMNGDCPAYSEFYDVTNTKVIRDVKTDLEGRFVVNNSGEMFYIKSVSGTTPPVVEWTDINPDKTQIILGGIGLIDVITSTVTPDQNLTYTSLDESVITTSAMTGNRVELTSVGFGFTNVIIQAADSTEVHISVFVINPDTHTGTVTDIQARDKMVQINTGSEILTFEAHPDAVIHDEWGSPIALRDIEIGNSVTISSDSNSGWMFGITIN